MFQPFIWVVFSIVLMSGYYSSSIYSFSTSAPVGGWLVSVTPRPRFSPGERTPGTHCTGGWAGPRTGLDTEARGNILSPLPGIEPRSPGRPARSQTLYWLSYPAHTALLAYANIIYYLAKSTSCEDKIVLKPPVSSTCLFETPHITFLSSLDTLSSWEQFLVGSAYSSYKRLWQWYCVIGIEA
jgi:hypothetical protein